ncbi:MAG TPA: flagellar basal body protein [Solirubrobacteraceae bacterium]|jgi:flagellar basal-body rod protein FlgB|nr:flagellar basal body protein [Solirubrobacteraceae bacterium]
MELFDTVHIALERALQGSSLRQEALAQNLANVNTPGYRRRDVDFHSALQAALPAGRDAVAATPIGAAVDAAAPVRADGNSVDVDAESANLAQNALEYEALAQVLRVRGDIVEIALGVR